MRKATFVLSLVVAAIGTISIATSSAQAAPVWQACEETMTMPEFSNSACSVSTGTKKWSWLEPTPSAKIVTINSTAPGVNLSDSKGGLFGETITMNCETSGSGLAGGASAKKGVVEELRYLKCKTTAGTCPSPTASSVNVPWATELSEPMSKVIRDNIKNSGAGTPGFKISCNGLEDTCTAETSANAVDETTGGIVEEEFDASSAKETCTRTGTGTGSITGTNKVLRTISAGLRVH